MEAPKVPTLDLKNKRKPGSNPQLATDDDDRNLSVIDPGGDYGQAAVSSSNNSNYMSSFLSNLGNKVSSSFGEDKETSFLFQRISVLIQRFNSVLLHDSSTKDGPDQ